FGLETFGFETLGFETFGVETFGFETFGFETFGFETLGFETFGFETFGFETFGLETFGLETFGLETFGVETFGLETFGLETLGFETFGLKTLGLETFGLETLGLETLETAALGLQAVRVHRRGRIVLLNQHVERRAGRFGQAIAQGRPARRERVTLGNARIFRLEPVQRRTYQRRQILHRFNRFAFRLATGHQETPRPGFGWREYTRDRRHLGHRKRAVHGVYRPQQRVIGRDGASGCRGQPAIDGRKVPGEFRVQDLRPQSVHACGDHRRRGASRSGPGFSRHLGARRGLRLRIRGNGRGGRTCCRVACGSCPQRRAGHGL